MNMDEHVGASLASDDTFHGPHHFPRLGKSRPCPHTMDLLSELCFASQKCGQTGFENQPFLYIFSFPPCQRCPPTSEGIRAQRDVRMGADEIQGQGNELVSYVKSYHLHLIIQVQDYPVEGIVQKHLPFKIKALQKRSFSTNISQASLRGDLLSGGGVSGLGQSALSVCPSSRLLGDHSRHQG